MANSSIKDISSNYTFRKGKNKLDIELIIILFFTNILLNISYPIKLLSLDDLNTCIEFEKMDFWECVFNTAANKFRPVYYFILKICYKIFLPNVILFSVFLLLLNFVVVSTLFFVIKRITKSKYLAFTGCVMYLVSRFSYYSITQVHGIMEQMGLLTAILILFYLYVYINEEKTGCFYLASILLFFISFIHERYIMLFVLLILGIILGPKSSKKFIKLKQFLFVLVVLFTSVVIRFYKLRGGFFDGTGGTSVKQTFSINSLIQFFLDGILYLFGISAGPMYLSGIEMSSVPIWVYALNVILFICILFTTVNFIASIFKDKSKTKVHIKNVVLFLSFIFLSLISSCITIRLEMRWVYTPYVGFIILLLYMLAYTDFKELNGLKNLYKVVAIIIVCAVIPMEVFFRSNWRNLYYWTHYQLYNSAYEQIVERYKEDAYNKEFAIISKHYGVFGENGEALNESLKINTNGRGLNIKTFASTKEFSYGGNKEGTVILTIDPLYQKLVNAE